MTPVLALASVSLAAAHPVTGTWKLDQTPDEVAARQEAALERSLASLPRMFRGIARDALQGGLTVCQTYRIAADGDPFSIQCDQRDRYERPLAGEHPGTSPKGEPLVSRLKVGAGDVHLAWVGDNGGRDNVFTAADRKMILRVRVSGNKLPTPVEWELSYTRAD